MNHPIPVLKFPVTKTGTYYNEELSRYEFWFFLNGDTALCGACKKDLPSEVIRGWRAQTLQGLQARVLGAVAQGKLAVNPLQNLITPSAGSGNG